MNLFKLFGEIAIKNDAANKNIDETNDKAKKSSEDIKKAFSGLGEATVKVGKTIAKGLAVGAAAIGALVAAAESSREYRTEMGKLDTAFETSGHSAETAKKTYQALQSVLGETDQSVEAANHLAKLCETEEDLATWTEICTGVYGTFGASLPIEGLTEAANETARCGQLTGPLTDAINWAAKSGEKFGVTLKENTAKNKEWNTAVENATSAEDYFNLALQECTTEQERQELIMETLNGLYGDAAKKYKETNSELIKANETTERMNALWAKVGDKIQPIVNTFKEGIINLGEALLSMVDDADVEKFCDALADAFEFLAEDVIPLLIDGLTWVIEHIELIAAIAVGAATAYITYQAAVLVVNIAHQGLTAAIAATTAAQTALNIVQSASPIGLLITAIGTLTAVIITLCLTTEDADTRVRYLTESELKLIDSAKEAAQALRDQKEAFEETASGTTSQMGYISDLATELMTLADSSGYVEEKDRSRVEFILGQLNEALGTEYELVDGVIQQYDKLTESISKSIQAQTASLLLKDYENLYTEAVKNRAEALNAVLEARDGVTTQTANAQKAYENYIEAQQRYNDALANGSKRIIELREAEVVGFRTAWEIEVGLIEDAEQEYDDAVANYQDNTEIITKYENAMAANSEENFDEVVRLLTETGNEYEEYADTVEGATQRNIDTLEQKAVAAGVTAAEMRRKYEEGLDGVTEETVAAFEEAYQEALTAYETAYDDACSVGGEFADGVAAGVIATTPEAVAAVKQMVYDLTSSGQEVADSNPITITVTKKDDGWDGYWDGTGSVSGHYNLNGSHADGLDYVPFDGYVAELHKGEMVLPAESAEFIRAGGGNGAVVQMLTRILEAIEGSNEPSETSIVFNNREFGRLVRGVL